MKHEPTYVPQPIADGWKVVCSCGWQESASFYDFDSKEALLEHLKKQHEKHRVEIFG